MKNYYLLFFLVYLLVGCSAPTSTVPKSNTVVEKRSKTNVLNPLFLVYHQQKDTSVVYFKLHTKEILYTRKDQLSPYQSDVQISYKLHPYGNTKVTVDSSTIVIKDKRRVNDNRSIIGNFKIPVEDNKDYLLKINTRDINRNSLISKKIYIIKTNKNNPQYFMLVNDSTEHPIFEHYITDSLPLQLHSEYNKGDTVFVKYYKRKFNIAAPPFASVNLHAFDYTPDSLAEVLIPNGDFPLIFSPDKGFMLFQTQTESNQGLTIFKFDENYPHIINAKGLIEPLRYLCSTSEYNTLLNSPTPKKSVDEFWLSRASSKARARELIRQYYNRVERANLKYTSYKEGWKTDRGMISIVFGVPTIVRKTVHTETWIYGEENNLMALSFIFNRNENPFTDNDFKLQRSSNYKSSWYRAVDTWRGGRVFYGY